MVRKEPGVVLEPVVEVVVAEYQRDLGGLLQLPLELERDEKAPDVIGVFPVHVQKDHRGAVTPGPLRLAHVSSTMRVFPKSTASNIARRTAGAMTAGSFCLTISTRDISPAWIS